MRAIQTAVYPYTQQLGLQDCMKGCLTKERIATKFVSSLGGEKERWTNNIAEYEEEISRLVGDALTLGGDHPNSEASWSRKGNPKTYLHIVVRG